MARRRNRLNWLYDNDLQQFTTPTGRTISLHDIAQLLQDQTESRHDFAGAWMGWRMRQNRLIPPGAAFRQSQITPTNLRAFARWLRSFEGEQAQLEFDTARDHDHQACLPQPKCAPSGASIARSSTSLRPQSQTEAELSGNHSEAAQEQHVKREPRRRAEVIQLAEYRLRVIAQ